MTVHTHSRSVHGQLVHPLRKARIEIVDALRGFALFGILIVHCARWFSAEALPIHLYQTHAAGPLNRIVLHAVEFLFVNKFYSFFSFLFGLSFALMISRSQPAAGAFGRLFTRRLLGLAAIGFGHYLHWRGDILIVYALLGFLLLAFNRATNAVIPFMAILLMLNLPANLTRACVHVVNPSVQSGRGPQTDWAARKARTNYAVLTRGSYADTVLANLSALHDAVDFQLESGRLFQTLGFFLAGLYAGRHQLFQRLGHRQALFRRVVAYGVLVFLATKAGLLLLTQTYGPAPAAPEPIQSLFQSVYNLRDLTLTVLYVAGLTLLFQHNWGRWAVRPLAFVGKMALTNYLLQTLLGSLLFFGYGLGLLGTVDLWTATLLAGPIFLFQIGFSTYWLRRYRYGPVEWLWRSLTYGKAQPMRVQAGALPG